MTAVRIISLRPVGQRRALCRANVQECDHMFSVDSSGCWRDLGPLHGARLERAEARADAMADEGKWLKLHCTSDPEADPYLNKICAILLDSTDATTCGYDVEQAAFRLYRGLEYVVWRSREGSEGIDAMEAINGTVHTLHQLLQVTGHEAIAAYEAIADLVHGLADTLGGGTTEGLSAS